MGCCTAWSNVMLKGNLFARAPSKSIKELIVIRFKPGFAAQMPSIESVNSLE